MLPHEGRLDTFATRRDLEIWGGALEHRLTASITAAVTALTVSMTAALAATELRLSTELARHARAIEDSAQAAARAVDEKYADLSGRVAALERTVR